MLGEWQEGSEEFLGTCSCGDQFTDFETMAKHIEAKGGLLHGDGEARTRRTRLRVIDLTNVNLTTPPDLWRWWLLPGLTVAVWGVIWMAWGCPPLR